VDSFLVSVYLSLFFVLVRALAPVLQEAALQVQASPFDFLSCFFLSDYHSFSARSLGLGRPRVQVHPSPARERTDFQSYFS
jgi:hypothetical protein